MMNRTRKTTIFRIFSGATLLALGAACGSHEGARDEGDVSGPEVEVSDASEAAFHTEEMAERAELSERLRLNPNDEEASAALDRLNAESARNFGLLTEVVAPEGQVVQFFEPVDGSLVVTEKHHTSQRAVDLTQDPRSLWSEIAPGQQMPNDLEELVSQLEIARAKGEEIAVEPVSETAPDANLEPAGDTLDKHITSSGSHFRDDQNGCTILRGNVVRSFCWLNRTDNWRESRKVATMSTAMAVYRGTVDWTVAISGNSRSDTVPAGEHRIAIHRTTRQCDPFCGGDEQRTMTARIDNGAGDGWHWGGSFTTDLAWTPENYDFDQ